MRSKWLTLAFVASLGPTAFLCPANVSQVLAADDGPPVSDAGTDARRRALDLLRQAAEELQANRFDAARSLAQQAASLHATFSLFDTRPEHVLAEIDRRESGGIHSQPAVVQTLRPVSIAAGDSTQPPDPVTPAKPGRTVSAAQAAVESGFRSVAVAAALTPEQIKARAIAILDRGLQALDEKRLDDAERYARAAQSLHTAWNRFEYRPENLITEIGIARASIRLTAAETQPASPAAAQPGVNEPSAASETRPQPTPAPSAELQREAVPVPARPLPQAASPAAAPALLPVPAPAPAQQTHRAAQPATNSQGANSSHARAERLLQEALNDLHEGRDDMARARIEGALGVIHPSAPRPLPLLFPGANPAGPSPQPHSPLLQSAMPHAGMPVYPIDRAADERDIALKPMHDPFMGDDPLSTQKSTAGEQTLREGAPRVVTLNPNYTLNRPLPVMTDEPVYQLPNASNSVNSSADAVQNQAAVETQIQSARVHWPEGDPATPASQPAAVRSPSVGSAAAGSSSGVSSSGVSSAGTASGISSSQSEANSSPPARPAYSPPTSDPWAPGTTDEQRPGYFHRVWSALTGG